MAKIHKLYSHLVREPRAIISFSDFLALVEGFGFDLARSRGSHLVFVHPACPRPLVLQPLGKDAKRYQVRQFLDMIEEYGLKLEP